VVVVNWRRAELTARSVRSVLEQVSGASVECVVVDNESTAASAAELRMLLPEAVVVPVARNSGFAGGVAAGIAAARGAVIVLVNNDAVVQPGFIDAGLARLAAEGDDVAAVAARVDLEGAYTPVDGAQAAGDDELVGVDGARWRESGRDSGGRRLVNSTGVSVTSAVNGFDRDWLALSETLGRASDDDPFGFSGAAVFLRRDAIDAVGGFDTRYFMYYEDLDLSWRLRLAGYRVVYEPDARVLHRHAGSSSHSSPLIRVNSMQNRWLSTVKNGSPRLVAAVTARTAARFVKDVLAIARGVVPFIAPLDWLRILVSSLRLLPGTLARRRAAPRTVARRSFEKRFFTGA
jgi:GT2 family glycosyltransferase